MKCNKTGIEVEGSLGEMVTALQDEILRLRDPAPTPIILVNRKVWEQVKIRNNELETECRDLRKNGTV